MVIVVQSITVLINAVIPNLGGDWVDGCIGVITIPIGYRKPVIVTVRSLIDTVIVWSSITIIIDAIVVVIECCGVDVDVGVITIGSTILVRIFTITVLVII